MTPETSRVRRIVIMTTVAATVVAAACLREQDGTTAPMRVPTVRKTVTPIRGSKYRRADEDYMVALEREEPSFAGFFLDKDGTIAVYFADSTRLIAGRQMIERHRASEGLNLPAPNTGRPLKILRAKYSFQQLSDWRDMVTDSLLGRDGVIYDDLDESINQVTIGVDRGIAGADSRASMRAEALGIPPTALHMRIMGPIVDAVANRTEERRAVGASGTRGSIDPPPIDYSSLQGTADTLGGGLLIGRYYPNSSPEYCSIGVVADNSAGRGFLTASHCTRFQFHPDTTHYWQPDSGTTGASYVGYESIDPLGSECGLDLCRGSDAAFIRLTGTIPGRRGAVLRTTDRETGRAGGITISTSNPWINMRSGETSVSVGETLDKVGFYTGWTYGTVSHTCADFDYSGYTATCEIETSIWVHTGDSGSAAFWWDGGDGGIYFGDLAGLECSSSPCVDGNDTFFSSYQQTEGDLGSLNVTSEITVGTPDLDGSIDGGGNPIVSWSSVSTSNTNATTYYSVFSQAWDAATCTWLTTWDSLGTTSSTSWTDATEPEGVSSFVGTSEPDGNTYSFVETWVVANNSGIIATSAHNFFEGSADGGGGTSCNGGGLGSVSPLHPPKIAGPPKPRGRPAPPGGRPSIRPDPMFGSTAR